MSSHPLDPWQYRLTEQEAPHADALGAMWLEVGPDLPKCQVFDKSGEYVGILLGFAIDLEARSLIEGRWQLPFSQDGDPDSFALKVLDLLGGRFLWVFSSGKVQRVYPDCSAQVSCVFDPMAHCIGSTAHALLDDAAYDARFNKELFDKLGVNKEGWFPAGLTAHEGIKRLLPNHYLDLETWQVQRFWAGPMTQAKSPDEIVEEIIEVVKSQLEAFVKGPQKVAMALTGGHETRLLLACVRPYIADVEFLTVTGGDRHETDTVIAQRIAGDLGLSHITLPRVRATPEQREIFIRRGGHCNADSNSVFHPSILPVAQTHTMIGGLGGEIARAFLWRASDSPETPITVPVMNARLGLPETAELNEGLTHWLAALDEDDAFAVLDLAYIEHRNGPWYAAQFCCDPTLVRQAPLLTMRTVDLMLQLPPEWKRGNRLGQAVIMRLWPELEKYPYNSLGKFKDTILKIQRVLSNPGLIAKKLRKMRH